MLFFISFFFFSSYEKQEQINVVKFNNFSLVRYFDQGTIKQV